MRRKGFLLQQMAMAAPWVVVALLLLVIDRLSLVSALLLLGGLIVSLVINGLLRWWQDSTARREYVLEGLLSSSPVMVWSFDSNGVVTGFRGRPRQLGKLSEDDAVGRDVSDCFADSPDFLDDIARALSGERLTVFRELGGRYYRHHLRPTGLRDGQLDGVQCVSVDLTREQHLINRVELAQKIFDHSGDAVVVADRRRHILMVNPAFSEITRFSTDDVVGIRLSLPPLQSQGLGFYREIWRTLKAGHVWRGDISARRKDGEVFSARMTLVPVRSRGGNIMYYLAFLAGVAAVPESQEELRYLANHDSLTGLPNRRLFLDRLNQAIRRARRSDRRLAIYFMDLDRFKEVNDSFGHQTGDLLLREVAERLRDIVRESDTVARFAGDEFTIIAEDVGDDERVARVADKILECFHTPFRLDGHEVQSATSIGIAVFPDDGASPLELLKSADMAMYRAKEGGRGRYFMCSQQRYLEDGDELQATRVDLGHALEQDQLTLVYQPIVSIDQGSVIGCEALLRWNHSQHGLLPAGEFISLAEQDGLITSFGDWVLRTACSQLRYWQDEGFDLRVLSVNLSRVQVADPAFPARLTTILKETRLDPRCLVLEIAESVVLDNLDETAGLVATLSARGIRFSIDDFGTGTSAYTYLKSLPVHLLKIDHRILNEARQTSGNEGFIRAMVSLADLMGMEIIAEGVEREPQEQFLRNLGCNMGQGYLYGRPVDAEHFVALLPTLDEYRRTGSGDRPTLH